MWVHMKTCACVLLFQGLPEDLHYVSLKGITTFLSDPESAMPQLFIVASAMEFSVFTFI